jgi:erythromycin esterase-like protein
VHHEHRHRHSVTARPRRAEITRRLIEQKGFAAVAVEADWPDALRVNRYVTWSARSVSSTVPKPSAKATTSNPSSRAAAWEKGDVPETYPTGL